MENKICPLLLACPDPDCPTSCQGDHCAWWVPPQGHREGRCAMQDLGALPVIAAAEVGRI